MKSPAQGLPLLGPQYTDSITVLITERQDCVIPSTKPADEARTHGTDIVPLAW